MMMGDFAYQNHPSNRNEFYWRGKPEARKGSG